MRAAVVVASDRAAAGVYADRSGPAAAGWFTARGWEVQSVQVVPDGEPVRAALLDLLDADDGGTPDVIVTSGGTGLAPSDTTPEATRALLEREVPGIAELVRARSLTPTDPAKRAVPGAALSRGVAGVAGSTLVVNLPGSVGGVLDGLDALADVLPHAVDQLHDGDHAHATAHAAAPPTAPRGRASGAPDESPGHSASAAGSTSRSAAVLEAAVVEHPIEDAVTRLAELVRDDACGAVATFAGHVRDHDEGRGVTALHYESHPDAVTVLATVAERVAHRVAAVTGDAVRAAVVHRVGDLAIGDVAVVVAVASGHRQAAFTCASELIEELKAEVPIWKEQGFTDGSSEWVGSLG